MKTHTPKYNHFLIIVIGLFVLSGCSNNPNKRSFGSYLDDKKIESTARREIPKSNPGFENAHLVIVSYNGITLLAGQVRSNELKQIAEDVVRNISKVRRIHNELTVAGPISYLARTNDAWLTSKVKSQFASDREVNVSHFEVATENGIVYLMGLVSHAEAELAVDNVRQTYGVQKIVKIFEYID